MLKRCCGTIIKVTLQIFKEWDVHPEVIEVKGCHYEKNFWTCVSVFVVYEILMECCKMKVTVF